MRGSLSGNLATMGPGVPYAIGAKFAHPDRPAIALVGDGAMQMNGMAELITVKRYWQEWSDPRLVVAVLHNNDLNQVTWEMRAMDGAPKFAESQDLPDVSYAGFAASLGLQAIEVHEPDEIGPAWERAFAADRPDGARRPHRPRRPAHPAARHLRADASDTAKAMLGGRRGRLGRHQDRHQAEGPGVPARHQGQLRWPTIEVAERRPGGIGGASRCTTSAPGASSAAWPGWPRPARWSRPAEIFTAHDGASFGNKMMWWPVVDRPDHRPGGCRRSVQPASGQDRAPAGVGGRGRQRPAGHVPALAGRHAEARRAEPTSATTSRWARRRSPRCWRPWWAGWGSWPRCCAAKGSGERRRSAAPPSQSRHSRATRAASRGFDVLDQVDRWDLVTAGVVLARLDTDPRAVVLHPTEEPTAGALLDLLLAQHDDPKVPVTELVDQRCWPARPTAGATTTCPRTARPGARPWPPSTTRPDAVFDERFHQLSRDATGQPRPSGPRRRQVARLRRRPSSGACGPATPAPPSTPIRGPGTRWASAAPPTRGATRTLGIDTPRGLGTPRRRRHDPVPWAQRRESAKRAHEAQFPTDDRRRTEDGRR